jgi:beta-catenin-like protein 1
VLTSNAFALQEYHGNIGDLDGPEEKERAQAQTNEIIAVL